MSQLALQLIQKEAAAKTGYLDIGNCGLTPDNPQLQDVWDALSELTHLETLILSNDWFDFSEKQKDWFHKESKNEGEKNRLDKIPIEIINLLKLTKLIIAGASHAEKWSITKIENLPQGITTLDISYNQISQIENLPKGIRILNIRSNQINKLENLPQNISILNIGSNQINQLENLPQSISQLKIHSNQISKLENLSQNINSFNISYNHVCKLENLPQSIYRLNIRNNQINKLENLPQSISWLDISENQINKLENLPDNLSELYISNNQVRKIENLQQNIKILLIGANKIKKIENLPQNIESLYINDNQISKIEDLPESIDTLLIHSNQISKIENLPQGISILDIRLNQINDLKPLLPFIKKRIDYNIGINPIENPPMEVVNQGTKAIIRYFEELEKSGKIQVKEAKLILSGSGEVGKTSLRFRLNDKEKQLPEKDDRTKQIEVDKYHFDTPSKENFTAHIWDFGGQQIIQGAIRFCTHVSFLIFIQQWTALGLNLG